MKPKQFAEQAIRRWNARISKALQHDDAALPKKLRKPRYTTIEAIQEIYKLLDRYYAESVGLIPCKKGCNFCCHSEIAISKLEADYIAVVTGIQPMAPIPFDENRSAIYCDPEMPCPFLDAEGGCTIYTCRPMLCRTHVSFEADNEKCRFGSSGKVFFIDRAKSFPGAMKAYIDVVERHHNGGGFADIRGYFGATMAVGNASLIKLGIHQSSLHHC